MTSVIETLRDEHRNSARLLAALEHQIEMLAEAAHPGYEVLQGIASYFCDYPDRCHHPKEDAVFSCLRAKYPKEVAAISDLAAEHRDVGVRARRFRDNIQALFHDALMPRDTVVGAARSFIESERHHMKLEEDRFFPLAEKYLAPEDWQSIQCLLRKEHDPLFGETVEETFRVFRERLLAWELEYRPD